jgi:site-specific DNA-methyltransferase (adenine-specific)
MKYIPDESIDLILADLPFNTTRNKWDVMIPLEPLWEQYRRIIKQRGCITLFSQQPFTSILACSNLEMLKYEWIWEKPQATGMLNCNFAPMKAHENILVFAKSAASYVKNIETAMIYNPQKEAGKPYTSKSGKPSKNYDYKAMSSVVTVNNGDRYPRDIITFAKDKEHSHPTQKPVKLLEYLIKTYTNENDIVLDNCFGSGSCAVACLHTNRNFMGIEKNKEYYNIARKWVQNEINMR